MIKAIFISQVFCQMLSLEMLCGHAYKQTEVQSITFEMSDHFCSRKSIIWGAIYHSHQLLKSLAVCQVFCLDKD